MTLKNCEYSIDSLDQISYALFINTLAYFGIFPKYRLLLYLAFSGFVVVEVFFFPLKFVVRERKTEIGDMIILICK